MTTTLLPALLAVADTSSAGIPWLGVIATGLAIATALGGVVVYMWKIAAGVTHVQATQKTHGESITELKADAKEQNSKVDAKLDELARDVAVLNDRSNRDPTQRVHAIR